MKQKILELFTRNNALKFNEIEKHLKTRSNKLAYHLKKLMQQGVLVKNKEEYALAESAEHLIPYLSERETPLPVLLIHIGNSKQAFFVKREKRPYKDKLSLPGGRIFFGESIKQATQRLMQEKYGIYAKLKTIHSITLEHVIKNKKTLHSFLLIFVSATTTSSVQLILIKNNKAKIISSDYHLLKDDLTKEIKILMLHSRTL